MKVVKLDPDEIEYCASLDFDSLMKYLRNKYGIAFQKQFKEQLREEMRKKLQFEEDEQEKWR